MLKQSVTIDDAVNLLNELFKLDKNAMTQLIECRVPCNNEVANHPTVQFAEDKTTQQYKVGILGLLNGLFGTDEEGCGAICSIKEGGKFTGFAKYQDCKED